jgi:branched-chain amino acid transport system substrate-binding protein
LTLLRILCCAVVSAALAVGVAACGSGSGSTSVSQSTASNTLTVYSSLPFRGPGATAGRGLVNGEKLALAQAHGMAGQYAVRYASLDEAPHGELQPGTAADNARKAVEDRSTIAYLDGGGDESSELSVPVLNQAGILEVSPASTYVGLTRVQGAAAGEPDKYYPSGVRTFGRVIPNDNVQAKAVVAYAKDEGCASMYVINDGKTAGVGLADAVALALKGQEITLAGNDTIDPTDDDFTDLGKKIKGSEADCVFFGGASDANSVRLWKQLHASNPQVKLFGPFALATPAFAKAIGAAGDVTYLTSPYLSPSQYPPAAKAFYAAYRKAYGRTAPADAIYGYEAMNAVLQAVRDAGAKGNDRAAVVKAFFGLQNRDSVLGDYSIDAKGDTTLSRYGGLRVQDGRLVFDQVIETS